MNKHRQDARLAMRLVHKLLAAGKIAELPAVLRVKVGNRIVVVRTGKVQGR